MRKPKQPPRMLLTIVFAMVVFVILTITACIMGSIVLLLEQFGLVDMSLSHKPIWPILAVAIASVMVGTVVATFLSWIQIGRAHV